MKLDVVQAVAKLGLRGAFRDERADAFQVSFLEMEAGSAWIIRQGYRGYMCQSGGLERLKHLCGILGLSPGEIGSLRYQLIHRTASAIFEARRYCTPKAVCWSRVSAPDDRGSTTMRHLLRLWALALLLLTR